MFGPDTTRQGRSRYGTRTHRTVAAEQRRTWEERVMADVSFERKRALSRQEAAVWLSALSAGFARVAPFFTLAG